jgi:hypothetical protein
VDRREPQQNQCKRALFEGRGNLIFHLQAFCWESRSRVKATLAQAVRSWRRGRDLNPRHPMGELDFESSAFSRARPPLRFITLPYKAKKIAKN